MEKCTPGENKSRIFAVYSAIALANWRNSERRGKTWDQT